MNSDPLLKTALDSIIHDLHDAKEYGSILTVAPVDFAALYARMDEVQNDISFHREAVLNTILPLIRVAEVLAQQYDVVVTNPPYLGSSRFSPLLDKYVKENYADVKSDLSMVMYWTNMLKRIMLMLRVILAWSCTKLQSAIFPSRAV